MSELRYHWSNPKFDGLPWAIDGRINWKARGCVWKPFSLADVREETARLRAENPGSIWKFKRCRMCKQFHVVRHAR